MRLLMLAALSLVLSLAAAYPGPMDYNCTLPPLSVVYGPPLGGEFTDTAAITPSRNRPLRCLLFPD
jgi:hypothetical protein